MKKSFSQYLTMTLLGFVAFSLLLVMGSLYNILSATMTKEFSNGLKVQRSEVIMELQDRVKFLEFRVKELSLNNAIRVNLMLGIKEQLFEFFNRQNLLIEGSWFLIHVKGDKEFIPKVPISYKHLIPYLQKLERKKYFQSINFINCQTGMVISLFAMPVKRKEKRLGTIYAIYDLSKDKSFWRKIHKGFDEHLLIQQKKGFLDLYTAKPLNINQRISKHMINKFDPDQIVFSHNLSFISMKEFPGLFFAVSSTPLHDKKVSLFIKLAALCALIFCFTILLAFRISYRISDPLKTMADQALNIAKEPSAMLLSEEKINYDEFKKLAQAFNLVVKNLLNTRKKEQRAKEFLDAIFNTVADPVFVKDKEHRFLSVNDACCQFLGYSRNEMIGKTASSLFSRAEADAFHKQDDLVLNTGIENVREGNITDFYGNVRLVSTKKKIFYDKYLKEKILVGIIRDITESKRLKKELELHRDNLARLVKDQTTELMKTNEQLILEIEERSLAEKKRQEMELRLQRAQKMEALGTLAGGVAHDLNNILSGIVSYPELLLMDIPEDSKFRQPILTIKKSGEKAAAVVQDLLTLARRGIVANEVVNLNSIVEDYLQSPELETLKTHYPQVNIQTDLEPNLLKIFGSPIHLSKMIMNLVVNAAEAIPGQGKILISSQNRYLDRPVKGYDDLVEGDYIILSVEDNGTGISPKDLERIFEPFYTKKVMGRSGTGLGMAVVWGTVKDHKGYIDLQSTEGAGTTVTLYFPVTRNDDVRLDSALKIDDYRGKGETILVVDDVQEQRDIASKMLEKLDYTVWSVSSGEEAVNFVKEHNVDLLVLDMIMDPGINGLETYKRIADICPNQKAIIASGFSETDDVKKAQKYGAGQYIKKPYSFKKIGLAVRTELDQC